MNGLMEVKYCLGQTQICVPLFNNIALVINFQNRRCRHLTEQQASRSNKVSLLFIDIPSCANLERSLFCQNLNSNSSRTQCFMVTHFSQNKDTLLLPDSLLSWQMLANFLLHLSPLNVDTSWYRWRMPFSDPSDKLPHKLNLTLGTLDIYMHT